MSELSKHFLEISTHKTCAFFLHPNETCTHQFIDMVWRNFFTVGQFYLPTLVVCCCISLAMKIKSLNREIFAQALIDYGKCILIAHWLSTVSIGGICLSSKIFGFVYPWFFCIPTAFGTLFFNYYPEKIKEWHTTGVLNMHIETLIRKSDIRIIEFLRKSRIFGTLMFMGFSAAVMTGFKITGIKRFWFTSMPNPTKDKNKPSEILKPCVHDGSCTHHIWNEFSKSSKLALIVGSLKFVVSNYKRIRLAQPIAAIKLLLQTLDYNMMAFTLSYNTIFKLLYCWFNNKTGENNTKNVIGAGFLSGITYSLYPIYMIYTHGLTLSLQMGWLMFSKYIASRIQDSKCTDFTKILGRLLDFINKLPISTLIMSLSMIQLFRYRFQYPYATPFYVHKFMSLTTTKRADRLALRISEIILGII